MRQGQNDVSLGEEDQEYLVTYFKVVDGSDLPVSRCHRCLHKVPVSDNVLI